MIGLKKVAATLYSPSGGGNSPCSTSKAVKSKLATWGGNSFDMYCRKVGATLDPVWGGNSGHKSIAITFVKS